jgi:hypothetical protein
MKALKSKLASQLLADPKASDQLLDFLLSKRSRVGAGMPTEAGRVLIRTSDGQEVQVSATLVPKASRAA